ncbi:hypothetical protein PHYPSEUDO_002668 [Phytophthora pseudosyringae]|uniref:Uncharacterized protein n=1 Tax=Phytophthora pseudosyringae TaxID=221518 RepID=A0A8T1WCZ6_9STRA|nr:hypothetical protein PHYPSEUDO_002668 [Phytophthora pseudosyringae]
MVRPVTQAASTTAARARQTERRTADRLPQEVTSLKFDTVDMDTATTSREVDGRSWILASGGAEDGSTKALADLRSEAHRTCGVTLENTQHGQVCARKHRAAEGETLESVKGGRTENGRRTDGTEYDSQTTGARLNQLQWTDGTEYDSQTTGVVRVARLNQRSEWHRTAVSVQVHCTAAHED